MNFLFFIILVLGFVGQLFDCLTTEAGINSGAKETVGPTAWVIKKFGIQGLYGLKVVVLGMAAPSILSIISQHYGAGVIPSEVVSGIAAVAGFIAGAINYARLKKAGIKVF